MKYKRKYNYFYKITNNLNNHYYYGIHSTDNIDDGYMGSGTRLHLAYKKYGIENFTKEILKYFDTREEASEYEAEMVTEQLVKDKSCYNRIVGGDNFNCTGMISARDVSGKIYYVSIDDPRYLSGELKSIWCGRKHKEEDIEKVKKTFAKIKHQQVEKNSQFGTCWVIKDNISIKIKKEELDKYISEGWEKGRTSKSKIKIKPKIKTKRTNGFQKGEKNSQFGTIWLKQNGVEISVKNKDIDDYLTNGWEKGRIKYLWINNGQNNTRINENKLSLYLNNGWRKGKKKHKW